MKKSLTTLFAVVSLAFVFAGPSACSSEAGTGDQDGGSTGKNCGEHGTPHEDHCHCDQGYLYDGNTCVAPEEIKEVCKEHEETDAGTEEHHHAACVCDSDPCPCEGGTVQTYAGKKYCVPDPHHHEG